MRTFTRVLAGLAVICPAVAGQIASSPIFQLDGISFDATVGGASNELAISWAQLGPLASDSMSSTNFVAEVGFNVGFDPDPGDLPVVWSVRPPHVDKAGGEFVQIRGRNLGLGLFPTMRLGGTPISGLNVVSDSYATGFAPAGAPGKASVSVTHFDGDYTDADGFVFSPAITAPAEAYVGSLWPFTNHGSNTHQFQTWASVTPWVAPTKFGVLLIGPLLVNFVPTFPYLGIEGATRISLRIPEDPLLVGFTIYLQNLNLDPGEPLGELTNSTQTLFL